jgi:protoheme ferro-lyase
VTYQAGSARRIPGSVNVCIPARNARRRVGAVIAPIGFLIDHIEVLYDLDTEAAAVASEIDLSLSRAETVGDHPLFLDMLADVVTATIQQYERGRALPIAAAAR